jgi:serine/threonine protein kinase/curved DNA-binding protein CbpA
MVNRIGQQFGNYRLIRLLGEGGFAEVYLGEHIHLSTQTAIKVLRTQLTSDDIEQFRAEARIIAHLEHPHIVRILDFGVEGKMPFLVMGYAPNGSLRQRHPKGVQLPLPIIVSYVKQVADALQYAHNEKIIHRDIKPENMLLGRRNEVLLSDFGIATTAQSSRYQSTQEMTGTMAYMAPEQIQGKPRLASDQYSLGIVVYEWLSGDRPFHGSLTELVGQHLTAPPPPLHEKLPELPPGVEDAVLTALAKEPKQRFPSIEAFASALEQACQLSYRSSSDGGAQKAPPNYSQATLTQEIEMAYSRQDWSEVIQKTNHLIEHIPDGVSSALYWMLAFALIKERREYQAHAAFEAALALAQNDQQRLKLLSDYTAILASQGRWAEVLAYTEAALSLAPRDPNWLAGQQRAQMMLQQPPSAFEKVKEPSMEAPADRKELPKDPGKNKKINHLFDKFFGIDKQRGADLLYDVTITFEEAVFGCQKEIILQRWETCPTCHGDGLQPGNRTMPCHKCQSQGRAYIKRRVRFNIPAGVDESIKVRLAGEGEVSTPGGTPGDLYVRLTVKPHQFFKRQGNDLIYELPISVQQARTGAKVEVPTLDNKLVPLKIPPGTQDGRPFHLKGLGVPFVQGSARGNQIVIVKVVSP